MIDDYIFCLLVFLAGATVFGLFLSLSGVGDDIRHFGRVDVASGQYECAKDIAGDWRCVELKEER